MKNSILAALFLLSSAFAAIAQAPTVGPYLNISSIAGSNTTVSPAGAPTNTTSMVAYTNTNFTGVFSVDPVTGIVRITDAKQAGIYPVTVKAFGPGGTATRSFTLTITNPNCSQGLFSAADIFTSGGIFTYAVAVGDFNNDGNQDYASTNQGTNSVGIFLGNGLGGFSSASSVAVGSGPRGLALGDFNGDGNQDLITANVSGNNASLRMGDGFGGFTGSTNIALLASQPLSIATGDFNNDGKLDFAAACYGTNDVTVRLGDGLGGFSGPTTHLVGSMPMSVAIGDFNGDGNADFVSANYGSGNVTVKLGNGLGGFGAMNNFPVGTQPVAVSIGDFNTDGIQDLATANYGSGTVSIRIGNGSGGFTGTNNYAAGSSPHSATLADFNGDGNLDFAASDYASNTVAIRYGDGLGSFSGTTSVAVGSGPQYSAVGDFDEDGRMDLAVANYGSNTVAIIRAALNEMNVRGNAIIIADGDMIPTTADHSDFGSVLACTGTITRTFTIENTGDVALSIGAVTVTGAHAADFSVVVLPYNFIWQAGSTTFQVSFDPSGTGLRSATINIANDDCDENPYNFAIQGTGNADIVNPVALCRNLTLYLNNTTGTASVTPPMVDNGSTDNCGIASRSVTPNSFSCANIGPNNVTLTVTDASGNSSVCVGVVTVLDSAHPVANCQNIALQLNAAGSAIVIPAMLNNGSTDNCGIASMSVSQNSFSCANIGPNNVTLTVTDNSGNSSSCIAVVTVADTVRPVANCRNISVHLNAGGTANITGAMVNNGSTDACGIASLAVSPSSFTCANVGANNVTLTVTDVNGRTSTCNSVVTVIDTVRPVANCQNISVHLNAAGTANITGAMVNNGSTDACGIASLAVSPSSFTCANVGANNVTLTVTDVNGRTSTCNSIVTVIDTIRPVAICQSGTIQIPLDGTGNATILASLVDNGSSDACGVSLMTVSPNTFNCASQGFPTLTLTVTDVNGNTSTCTSTAIVYDNAPPIANCQNINVYLDGSGNANVTPAMVNNGSTDECAIATMNVSPTSFSCINTGSNNVTLTVFDTMGATDQCVSVVTVLDTTRPVVNCQNITVQLNAAGTANIIPAMINNGSTDNCAIASMTVSPNSFSCANIGANNVTLTVTDASGNSSTCIGVVTVADTVRPVASCRNISVYLNAAGTANITGAMVNNGSADACGIASLSVSPSSFTCANVGANNVTLTVTDVNGRSSMCNSVVTVIDTVRPVASCRNITVYLNSGPPSLATITGAMVNNGSTDACGIALMSVVPSTFTCANVGPNTVTLTITDVNGNTSICSSVVTVLDTIGPIAYCRNLSVYLTSSGDATLTAPMVNFGSTDNCYNISAMSVTPTLLTCANIGANTAILTVTDDNGNTSTCSSTVNVLDTIRPVAICQNATVTLTGGAASISYTNIDNGSSDACGVASMSVSPNTFDCSDLGANAVILTVTDNNGNTSTCSSVVTVLSDFTSAAAVNSNVSCFGGNNGQATITTSGGAGPFTYSWSPSGGIAATASGLSAGTYTCMATDAGGCTTSSTVNITEPPTALAVTTVSGSILCNGGSTTVTVTGNGGTSPYTGIGTFTVTAGTYSYTVTDANGCTATTSLTITEPTPLVPASSGLSVLCNGGTTTVTVNCTGGTAPYTGTGTFTETAGTFFYTVTDANGCSAVTSINISEPLVLGANSSASPILCNGGNTIAIVSGTGGTPPYSGTGAFTEIAGTYSYTITDANGCTATTSVTITEPAAISTSVTQVNVSCNGGSDGSIDLTVSGGTSPYTFDWNNGAYTTEDISGLAAGTYTGVLTDANGCTDSGTIIITAPAVLLASVTSATDPTTCSGTDGAIDITVTGGTAGYSFLWNTSASTEDISGIAAGSYSCVVTDNNGCTANAGATLNDPDAPAVFLSLPLDTLCFDDGAIALGGESPVGGTFSGPGVSGGSFNPGLAGIGIHAISYTYTDINGCTGSATDSVNVDACMGIAATETNAFEVYPNPNNGSFTVQLNGTMPASVTIYDVQGKLVSTHNLQPAAVQQINIDGAGIYVIVIITSNNQMSSQRIVVTE